jgi:hypothetical protein
VRDFFSCYFFSLIDNTHIIGLTSIIPLVFDPFLKKLVSMGTCGSFLQVLNLVAFWFASLACSILRCAIVAS